MKKVISILAAISMAAALFAGCNSTSGDTSSVNNNNSNASTESTGSVNESEGSNFDTAEMINVFSRESGSGTRGAFIELFGIEVKGEDGSKTDMTTPDAVELNNTEAILTGVAGDTYSIGYVSLGSLNETVKALKIGGVEATADNVKNGSYEVARPFNIATKGEPTGLTKDFIDFILSKEGQAVVAGDYIPVDDSAAAYAGSKPEGKIVIAGSSSVSPVMQKLIEAYNEINPNATIDIQTTDSTAGMTAAIDGTCDIGMASRELKDSETAELTPVQIALDGIAVVVSPENPVEDLTSEQVRSIFTGETTEWSSVIA